MNPWDIYQARMGVRGADRRTASERRASALITAKLPSNLSYKTLVIDGQERSMAVLDSDELNMKTLCTMPGEDLPHGGLVFWKDGYWLITERDANDDLYAKGIMKRCNHLLRWVAKDNTIVERWCIVEDGTKYLTGEYSDKDFVVTRGDARIALTLARDEYSVRLNRTNRFLIDDDDAETPLAYRLTKPLKLGGVYNGRGVLTFVLAECNTEDGDNMELRIANYYDHFPKNAAVAEEADDRARHDIGGGVSDSGGATSTESKTERGRRSWL